jgi:hypothetical protein
LATMSAQIATQRDDIEFPGHAAFSQPLATEARNGYLY